MASLEASGPNFFNFSSSASWNVSCKMVEISDTKRGSLYRVRIHRNHRKMVSCKRSAEVVQHFQSSRTSNHCEFVATSRRESSPEIYCVSELSGKETHRSGRLLGRNLCVFQASFGCVQNWSTGNPHVVVACCCYSVISFPFNTAIRKCSGLAPFIWGQTCFQGFSNCSPMDLSVIRPPRS